MSFEKKCLICGERFIAEKGCAKYCGKECKAIAKRLGKVVKPETAVRLQSELSKIAAAARKAGLSYGKYVDRMGLK